MGAKLSSAIRCSPCSASSFVRPYSEIGLTLERSSRISSLAPYTEQVLANTKRRMPEALATWAIIWVALRLTSTVTFSSRLQAGSPTIAPRCTMASIPLVVSTTV